MIRTGDLALRLYEEYDRGNLVALSRSIDSDSVARVWARRR